MVAPNCVTAEWRLKFSQRFDARCDIGVMTVDIITGQEGDIGLERIGHRDDVADICEGNEWPMVDVGHQGDARTLEDSGKMRQPDRLAHDPAPLGLEKGIDNRATRDRAYRS